MLLLRASSAPSLEWPPLGQGLPDPGRGGTGSPHSSLELAAGEPPAAVVARAAHGLCAAQREASPPPPLEPASHRRSSLCTHACRRSSRSRARCSAHAATSPLRHRCFLPHVADCAAVTTAAVRATTIGSGRRRAGS
uniref:Uncharacterized protein n=1 Tax=Setaria italica TaxID=4555 RepID=K3YWL3_SETIT